ncbi:MAG: hypothetical protein AAGK17_09650 [Pseudomonadota bacterium]
MPSSAQHETDSQLEPDVQTVQDPNQPEVRGNHLVIRANSQLGFTLAQSLSSKTVKRGDLVQLTLRDDITYDGAVIVPAGNPAIGEVSFVQQNGFMGKGGRLAIRMLYLDLENGPVRVSGPLGSAGKDQTALATAVATATLGIAFFVKGKSAVIEEGTALDVVLDREARIPLGV